MTGPWLGAVADDFTGACDLADAVSEAGGSAVVVVGRPTVPPPASDCVVVALKSRTAPRDQAVAESLAAARWLLDAGCTTLYQKYCSTFDSTDAGNIGPVADALVDLIGDAVAVGTPATPRVGRTVYQGHLFVGRRLLSESPLRDHPLTPMRDPDLVRVLSRQAEGEVALVDQTTVAAGPAAVTAAVEAARCNGARHVIVDALADRDLDTLAIALLAMPNGVLAGGAAGLAAALARTSGTATRTSTAGACRSGVIIPARTVPVVPEGRQLILSGSCSERTREQVNEFPGPRVTLSPVDLDIGFAETVDAVAAAVAGAYRNTSGPVLVTSSSGPEHVARYESRLGPGRAAALLEAATAQIARHAVDTLGVRCLLVAGGETSGAVVRALKLGTLRVGPTAGPGLPWMVAEGSPTLALLLKSGNFGEPDLFTTAWRHCP
ncbi:four-carbon acid sugar kinase family protein [Micromonospora sp. AMSO12t]|uniref:3-oxo-tetronate kinase n=1 Tax=Micromonospora sp. AMSO12t TaxID=2650410 RepID=UPI00124BA073|nr:3-oxo-tetronate kinase [Micromonospora sp. AMSO12t]KAB1161505.1 four-carbon acid sugar kinase family protein [Micromonospora sp. AMSO12t]